MRNQRNWSLLSFIWVMILNCKGLRIFIMKNWRESTSERDKSLVPTELYDSTTVKYISSSMPCYYDMLVATDWMHYPSICVRWLPTCIKLLGKALLFQKDGKEATHVLKLQHCRFVFKIWKNIIEVWIKTLVFFCRFIINKHWCFKHLRPRIDSIFILKFSTTLTNDVTW